MSNGIDRDRGKCGCLERSSVDVFQKRRKKVVDGGRRDELSDESSGRKEGGMME
jgi:hypothetical protein